MAETGFWIRCVALHANDALLDAEDVALHLKDQEISLYLKAPVFASLRFRRSRITYRCEVEEEILVFTPFDFRFKGRVQYCTL